MRVHVRSWVIAVVLAAAFGAGDQYLGSLARHPWGAARSLSAPWLLLAFEPLARELTASPVRFLDVAIVEVVAGLALAAAVLARSGRLIK